MSNTDETQTTEWWEVEGEPGKWWPIDGVLIGDPPRGGRFRKRTITVSPYEYIDGVAWTDAETTELKARFGVADNPANPSAVD